MRATRLIGAALAALLIAACAKGASDGASSANVAKAPAPPARYDLGHPATPEVIAAVDLDVSPAGVGLPPGSGTAARGAQVYAEKCASCHGPKGEGIATNPKLVGRDPRDGFPFGNDVKLVKTVGNYWPYATTVFDYVRRAMPLDKPGSLANDDVYALVAWLLAENEIIDRTAVLDAKTLPAVQMPAKAKFVRDDRKGGAEFK
jgi:cytochrome c